MGTVETTTFKGEIELPSEYDMRISVRLGRAADTCNIHGHIYVVRTTTMGRKKNGEEYTKDSYCPMIPSQRRHPPGGRCPAYWVWGYYPERDIPPGSQDDIDDDKPIMFGKA